MERPRFGVHFLVNTLLVMTLVPKCVALFVLAARKLIAGLWPFLISARHAVACSCSAALALASSSSLAHLSLVLISSVIPHPGHLRLLWPPCLPTDVLSDSRAS